MTKVMLQTLPLTATLEKAQNAASNTSTYLTSLNRTKFTLAATAATASAIAVVLVANPTLNLSSNTNPTSIATSTPQATNLNTSTPGVGSPYDKFNSSYEYGLHYMSSLYNASNTTLENLTQNTTTNSTLVFNQETELNKTLNQSSQSGATSPVNTTVVINNVNTTTNTTADEPKQPDTTIKTAQPHAEFLCDKVKKDFQNSEHLEVISSACQAIFTPQAAIDKDSSILFNRLDLLAGVAKHLAQSQDNRATACKAFHTQLDTPIAGETHTLRDYYNYIKAQKTGGISFDSFANELQALCPRN